MSKQGKCITLSAARVSARQILKLGGCKEQAKRYGLNAGLVSAIRRGKRQASRRVLAALGIAYAEEALAPVCRVHGVAHGKQCRQRKTFEQNAAEYETWLKRNAAALAKRVADIEMFFGKGE